MDTVESLGDRPQAPDFPARAGLSLTLMPVDMQARWKRCSLTADYLADVLASEFSQPELARNTLSTVINELLENAVKFSPAPDIPARITVEYRGNCVRLETENLADRRHAQALAARLQELSQADLEQLFVQQVEANAACQGKTSRLGLLTLKHDYRARLGAQLSRTGGGVRVQLWVELDREQLDS